LSKELAEGFDFDSGGPDTSSGIDFSGVTDTITSGVGFSSVTDVVTSGVDFSSVTDTITSGVDFSSVTDVVSSGVDFSSVTDTITSGVDFTSVTDTVDFSSVMDTISSGVDFSSVTDTITSGVDFSSVTDTITTTSSELDFSGVTDTITSGVDVSSVTDTVTSINTSTTDFGLTNINQDNYEWGISTGNPYDTATYSTDFSNSAFTSSGPTLNDDGQNNFNSTAEVNVYTTSTTESVDYETIDQQSFVSENTVVEVDTSDYTQEYDSASYSEETATSTTVSYQDIGSGADYTSTSSSGIGMSYDEFSQELEDPGGLQMADTSTQYQSVYTSSSEVTYTSGNTPNDLSTVNNAQTSPASQHRPTRPQQQHRPPNPPHSPRPQTTRAAAPPVISSVTVPQMNHGQSGVSGSVQPFMVPMTYLDPLTGEQKTILVPMTPMLDTGTMQMMPAIQEQPSITPGRRQQTQSSSSQSPRSVSFDTPQVSPSLPSTAKTPRRVSMPAGFSQQSMAEERKSIAQQIGESKRALRTRMVSTPALDIHSPYHITARDVMRRITREPVSRPAQGPLTITPSAMASIPRGFQGEHLPPPQTPQSAPQLPLSTVSNVNMPTSGPPTPFPPVAALPASQHIQQDDTSDAATSSTVDVHELHTNEIYDARSGDEGDLTEYISYEDALKYSPVEVSSEATSVASDKTSATKVEIHELHTETAVVTKQEGCPVEVTQLVQEIDDLSIPVPAVQEPRGQEETVKAKLGGSHQLPVQLESENTDDDPFMDLDDFNKEIEEARQMRLLSKGLPDAEVEVDASGR